MESDPRPDVEEALAISDAARAAGAAQGNAPWWYYPGLGVAFGAGELFLTLDRSWETLVAGVVTLALLFFLPRAYRAKTGVVVGSLFSRSGAPWTIALLIVLFVSLLIGIYVHDHSRVHETGWAWGIAGFLVVTTTFYGWLFDRYRGATGGPRR